MSRLRKVAPESSTTERPVNHVITRSVQQVKVLNENKK